MANPDAKTQARASLMTARILWASLLGATVMFLGVLLFLGPQQHRDPVAVMLPAFGFVALTIAVLSFVLPQRLYTQALERIEIDVVERPSAQGSDVIPDRDAAARLPGREQGQGQKPRRVRRLARQQVRRRLSARLLS